MAPKILVVDDDPAISEMLTIVLESEGLKPIPVMDGNDAVPAFEQHEPDLILLDLMLPGMNGVDICRAIRRESSVPIVMLTAKTDTVDVVLGLESGADDYITKPFKPKELIARIRARLRRTDSAESEILEVADLVIDVPEHTVRRTDGTELNLTPLEFDLLLEMARRPGQVHTGLVRRGLPQFLRSTGLGHVHGDLHLCVEEPGLYLRHLLGGAAGPGQGIG